jgi:N-acetylneuraminic acid mutarotase
MLFRRIFEHTPVIGMLVSVALLGTASISLAQGTWTTKGSLNFARWGLGSATVNGKIYAIGGEEAIGGGAPSNRNEEYDPVTNVWTSKAPMLIPRVQFGVCALNGKVYAVGGIYVPSDPALNIVEEYDPVTNTWTTRAPLPTGSWGVSSMRGQWKDLRHGRMGDKPSAATE